MKKSQQGSSSLTSLIVVALIIWGGYVTLYVPYENKRSMDEFRGKPPALSPAKMALVNAYRHKPSPEELPHGLYIGNAQQDGHTLDISFYFADEQTIIKKAAIKGNQLSGSARYEFVGSLMVFSNVQGDRVLFAEAGEPLDVNSATEIQVPGPGAALVLTRK